jgi:hypothetical protein
MKIKELALDWPPNVATAATAGTTVDLNDFVKSASHQFVVGAKEGVTLKLARSNDLEILLPASFL